jgi:hypothetical protein
MALIKCPRQAFLTEDTTTIKVMISGPSASVQDNRIQFEVYYEPIVVTANTG